MSSTKTVESEQLKEAERAQQEGPSLIQIIRKLSEDVAELKSSTSDLDESLKGLQELTEDNHRELLETIRDSIDTGSGFSVINVDDDPTDD